MPFSHTYALPSLTQLHNINHQNTFTTNLNWQCQILIETHENSWAMHKHFIGKSVGLPAGENFHPYKGEMDLVSSFYFNPSFKKRRDRQKCYIKKANIFLGWMTFMSKAHEQTDKWWPQKKRNEKYSYFLPLWLKLHSFYHFTEEIFCRVFMWQQHARTSQHCRRYAKCLWKLVFVYMLVHACVNVFVENPVCKPCLYYLLL